MLDGLDYRVSCACLRDRAVAAVLAVPLALAGDDASGAPSGNAGGAASGAGGSSICPGRGVSGVAAGDVASRKMTLLTSDAPKTSNCVACKQI